MPQFYETQIGQQRAALKKEEYVEACLLFQRRYGRLRYAPLKSGIALALCAAFVVNAFSNMSFSTTGEVLLQALATVLALAGFGWLAYCFFFGMRKKEAEWAGKNYDKSLLPGIEEEKIAYRDSFEVKNECETMTGFWSECGGCCRKGDLLVVNTAQNLSRNMLVFQRSAMAGGEYEKLCEHLKFVFVKRYQESR